MDNIDDVMTILYAESNESFVERRNQMAKEIRRAGDRELAKQVKALRKPSAVASLLNRIVRDDPEGVSDLLEAVEDLQEAQAALLAGKSADFASLQTNYRASVQALSGSAPEVHRFEVKAAIEAAALDSVGRRHLRHGTFVTPPATTGGFGFASDFVLSVPSPKTSGRKAKKATPSKTSHTPATDTATRERQRFLRRATIAAEANVVSTEKTVGQADKKVKDLDHEIAILETRISALRDEHDAARQDLETAIEAAGLASAELAKLHEG